MKNEKRNYLRKMEETFRLEKKMRSLFNRFIKILCLSMSQIIFNLYAYHDFDTGI